jgi:transcriptional regulator with XRE-family HTH domain
LHPDVGGLENVQSFQNTEDRSLLIVENQLGKTIRILRQAKALKLSKVAEDCEVSVSYLSLVESGERQPSLDVVRRLAGALKVPADVLLMLGMEPGTLTSSRGPTSELTNAVGQLMVMEGKLSRLLDKEAARASKQDQTRAPRRRDGNKRR